MGLVHKRIEAIVIGGSAGSFPLVVNILKELPYNFPLPIFLALHRLKHVRTGFVEALSIKSKIEVVEPCDKDAIVKGKAFLAPSNYHLLIENKENFSLTIDEMIKFSRPSIDILLESAGIVYKQNLLGILLSGANTDGAYGMKAIHDNGGYTIVQQPEEATIRIMPDAAIKATEIDEVKAIQEIIDTLKRFR